MNTDFILQNRDSDMYTNSRDSPGKQDKGAEVPSLSRDKGTTGQAQNLLRDRPGGDFNIFTVGI